MTKSKRVRSKPTAKPSRDIQPRECAPTELAKVTGGLGVDGTHN